jgi:hypothetical protein
MELEGGIMSLEKLNICSAAYTSSVIFSEFVNQIL